MTDRGMCSECEHSSIETHTGDTRLVCWVNGFGMVTGAGGTCPKWEERRDGK